MASNRSALSSDDESGCTVPQKKTGFVNVFQNDGSFLEMFKKMQKASQTGTDKTVITKSNEIVKATEVTQSSSSSTTSTRTPSSFIGRRRGSKALPVGKVKKLKTDEEEKPKSTDAWAKYLDEVKKYKETYCDGDAKNRPLVK